MGLAPAQIVGDARAHGVEIRPACVNRSRWDCTLEKISGTKMRAVRLGMRMVRGLASTVEYVLASCASVNIEWIWL